MTSRMASLALLFVLTLCVAHGEETAIDGPSIEGIVSSPDGKKLDDVRVDVSTAAPKVGRGIFCPSCYLDCGKWTTTDEEGRFSIKNVNALLKFRLVVTTPGRRTLQTKLIDPLDGPLSLTMEEQPKDIDDARMVSGLVTQEGVPVAGALVEPHGAKTAERRWWGRVDGVDPTVTDSDGYFAIVLPDDFMAVDIQVTGHGFCGEQLALLEPGRETLPIEVRTGATIVGRVEFEGKPVVGLSLAVVQLERGVTDGFFIAAVGDVTDDAGRFEFRHLPPDQRYCIYSLAGESKRTDSRQILTTKTFTAPSTGKIRDLGSLEVSSPFSIRGRVECIDSQPLPESLKLSFGRDPAWDLIEVPVQNDGSFEVTGLPPETYEIRIGDRDLVIVADQLPYQMLSEVSFGIRLRDSVENLTIAVRRRE